MSESTTPAVARSEAAPVPRPPVVGLAVTGVLTVLLAGLYLFATPLLLALSAMCTDDGDASDCASLRVAAAVPLVLGVVGVALWRVGVARCGRPGAVGWAVGGLVAAVLPVVLVFLAISG